MTSEYCIRRDAVETGVYCVCKGKTMNPVGLRFGIVRKNTATILNVMVFL